MLDNARGAFIQDVTRDVIRSWARNEEDLAALETARFGSAIVAPLYAHGQSLGAFTLIGSGSAGAHEPDGLRLVEAIADRAALAFYNARLYRTARRATKARDEILGIVAHDLRNPLTAVVSLADVLRKKQDDREIADEIAYAAKRMNRLIQDLLDVARMEAGRLSLKRARVPVAEIISDAIEAQMPLASAASLELRLDAAPDMHEVWADRDRLLQVFENLIGNAIKFTSPGGRITLGATAGADEVVFSVSDTGGGIAASHLPHIFDRFWQAPENTPRGMGFGLAIVKGIVETHGGRVWVESQPGRGSTFLFTIPMPPASRRTGTQRSVPHRDQAVRHMSKSEVTS